jgi:hypothetical protein
MSSGGRANHTGYRFELFVTLALKEHAYTESTNGKELFKKRALITTMKCYARGVDVGKTAYGGQTRRKVDIFIIDKALFPHDLIIECKWQQVKGSTDEKYPNLVNNIKTTGIPTIIVIGGGGYKPGALSWLKQQVDGTILLAVWTMEEFQIAVNDGLLNTGLIKSVPPTPLAHEATNPLYERGLWD